MNDMAAGAVTVALVADTHGFLDPRVAEVAAGCDRVVHAGDIGGDAILSALDHARSPTVAVSGNNDTPCHWPPADQIRLAELVPTAELALPGGRLIVVHGHQWPARVRHVRMRQRWPTASAVVCGHSHRRVIDTDTTPWVLNPGAAGRSRTYGGPSCLVLTASARHWQVTEHHFEPLGSRRRSQPQ